MCTHIYEFDRLNDNRHKHPRGPPIWKLQKWFYFYYCLQSARRGHIATHFRLRPPFSYQHDPTRCLNFHISKSCGPFRHVYHFSRQNWLYFLWRKSYPFVKPYRQVGHILRQVETAKILLCCLHSLTLMLPVSWLLYPVCRSCDRARWRSRPTGLIVWSELTLSSLAFFLSVSEHNLHNSAAAYLSVVKKIT